MKQDEAYALMQACVAEVQKRLIINLPNFQVQLVNKDGIKNLKDITVKSLP
jgi:20S proteasome subunit beta 4